MELARHPHLRPFDVPAVGTGWIDTNRLLVGIPDPAIGAVLRAWSNVPTREPKKTLNTGPACGIGVLAFLVGAAIAMKAASGPVEAGAYAMGLGIAGFFLGGQIRLGGPEKMTWYIGARGVQRNGLVSGRVVSHVFRFDEHHLLSERVRRFAGTPVDRVQTRLDLLPRAPGQMTTFLPPMITADLREHILDARLRTLQPSEPQEFPIITRPLDAVPSWCPERTGMLRLLPDTLELTFDGRTERAPLVDLLVKVNKGRLLFDWAGKRAETELRNVGDGSLLLALLASHGRLQQLEA